MIDLFLSLSEMIWIALWQSDIAVEHGWSVDEFDDFQCFPRKTTINHYNRLIYQIVPGPRRGGSFNKNWFVYDISGL